MSTKDFLIKRFIAIENFKPNKAFYLAVNINSRRWAKIVRGKIEPKASELRSISDYFQVEITELL